MESSIYKDIAERTDGDIYIGVVGPVRTGKSTFIKKFMEHIVLPNIESQYRKERAIDELPQSSAGKTIMTTEPKFIPEEAVSINLSDNASLNVRLIDCVGYIVPSSLGYIENDIPRMVQTPWFDDEIPFNMAAEVGTQKVITEHSTIGLVVTTDGSISDIPRDEYEEVEERVIEELKEINKPFVVLLNCSDHKSNSSIELSKSLSKKYSVPVIPVNCVDIQESDIKYILERVLFQFPIKKIMIDMPKWITTLESNHWLKNDLFNIIKKTSSNIVRIDEINDNISGMLENENIDSAYLKNVDLGKGSAELFLSIKKDLFYNVLSENTGLDIKSEAELMPCIENLSKIKKEYEKIQSAIEEVNATGYGIVMPTMEDLELEEPEIIKQGGRYGVKLKASAPSIHLMKADITAEVSPIVGSEKQSEDLIKYLLKEFEENPTKIWGSNIFGKSLHELVNEGLQTKLHKMPSDARLKIQETLERIINEGCGGLICILL
ncbi:MAG: stage IV sporulation protein A [Oscillospiraceae bacterium]|nr:stage IV sporulation protein A [Oscillospiraceae bacterium]